MELVSVQALPKTSGALHYMDYVYSGDNSGRNMKDQEA